MQAEAAKVAKVREVTIAKLKSLEKQKSEVEKTRDDIKYVQTPSSDCDLCHQCSNHVQIKSQPDACKLLTRSCLCLP